MNKFQLSTEIVFGEGAMDRLDPICNQKVFIVCDAFMESSGMVNLVIDKLPTCEISVFSKVVPDPSLEAVAASLEAFRAFSPTVLIALGGGSAIDTAKAIIKFANQLGGLGSSLQEFIALPTTSGTGSEVTSFSVVTDTKKQVKIPLVDDEMLPTIAILDARLTVSVPPAITADTGMDVITHALEALVSKRRDDFSDALAQKALQIAWEFLPKAYLCGDDIEAREKMHNASCLAGIAFNHAGLGINHSLAHAVGGLWHLPHGRANALILPYVIEFNADAKSYLCECPSEASLIYQKAAKSLGLRAHNPALAVADLTRKITEMNEVFGIPATLSAAGIDRQEVLVESDNIAHKALNDVCTQTNPREVDTNDLKNVLLSFA